MTVEQRVYAPVGCFLTNEPLDFRLILPLLSIRERLMAISNRIDEKLFTYRKTHRKCVEESGTKSVAITPMARKRYFEIDEQAAYNKIGHG